MSFDLDEWHVVALMFIVGTITTSCAFGYGVYRLAWWLFP